MPSSELRAPNITLRSVQPNEGVRSWYRRHLQRLARRMAIETLRCLKQHYRPASSRLSMDDDPIVTLRRALNQLKVRWNGRFAELSRELSVMFAKRSRAHLEAAMKRRLSDAGFTVRFTASERMTSAYRAVIAEQVGLIKSIPEQFHKDVEGAVWRSVTKGGALGELTSEIKAKYGIAYRRAAFIARDQSAKAKSVFERERRLEIGVEVAEWRHSHAGKEPRPTHLAMHGQRFKIAEGLYDSAEGRYIQPGELPNCRCTSRAIIPGVEHRA